MPEKPPTAEQVRASLEDTLLLVDRLAPLCKDFDDLVGILTLALTNDAQLKILMDRVYKIK